MKDILDHRSTEKAVKLEDAFEGEYKNTTAGWELLVEWGDKTQPQLWIPLEDLKEYYPIQVAEYAKVDGISGQPVFIWWVPYSLRKRINMISRVKSRYWKRTHRYGIKIPKNYKHVMHLYEQNGTNLWRLAWEKDMKNVQVAFDVKDEGEFALIVYQEIGCRPILRRPRSLGRFSLFQAGIRWTHLMLRCMNWWYRGRAFIV